MNFLSAGFKVGDRVECVGLQSENHAIIGKCGKIIWMSASGLNVSVEFDHPFPHGHRGTNDDGRPGCCWNFSWERRFEKLRKIEDVSCPPPEIDGLF